MAQRSSAVPRPALPNGPRPDLPPKMAPRTAHATFAIF